MSILQFTPVKDFETIPYLPLNAGEKSELRFQVKNPTEQALQGEIKVWCMTGQETLLWSGSDITFAPGAYFFQKINAQFPEGTHTLKFQWKASDEQAYEEQEVEITAEAGHQPLLSGGFVMLHNSKLKHLTEEQWEQVADAADAIGVKMMILFVTLQRADKKSSQAYAHYPSRIYPRSDMASDAVEALLRAADRNGQEVMIGLGEPLVRTPENVKALMEEIHAFYGHHKSFYGWYSSCEINMAEPDEEKNWEDWMRVRESADAISPVKPVMTSPFLDNRRNTADMDPGFLESLRSGRAGFDILMPQDMVGHVLTQGCNGGKLTPAESGRMFAILKPICEAGGVHLWANCEAFDFNPEETDLMPRYVNGGMYGELGYLQQLKEAAPHTEKVLTYKLTEMFTAPWQEPCLGGQAAVEQYENYLKYRNETVEE